MPFFLELINGPKQGEKYEIREGFRIGRTDGDLLLDDGKVSSLHAQIELDNKGQSVLVDQASSNGLILNQKRVKKIALIPGVQFRIGDSEFRVIELKASEIPKVLSWKDQLQKILDQQPPTDRSIAGASQSFHPSMELEFIKGPQAEESIVLSYGPRQVGFGHLDVELIDPEAPDLAFELKPGAAGVKIRDFTRGRTLLNGQKIDQDQLLQEGDLIQVGNSVMKIHYI